jgi:peptidoglycan/LPS O-acetylase OafA/YrhL
MRHDVRGVLARPWALHRREVVIPTGDQQHAHDAGRDPNLDRLRYAALAALFAYHVALFLPVRGSLHGALVSGVRAGWIGTDLFLALAGSLCVRSIARARAAGERPIALLARRALRTLPAYYGFLGLYLYGVPALLRALQIAASDPLLGEAAHATHGMHSVGSELSLFTLTCNLYFAEGHPIGHALEPLFSFSLGAQLVLSWTLLLWVLPERRWLHALAAAWVFACVLRLAWYGGSPWRAYASTLTRVDAFVWGAALAQLTRTPESAAWLARNLRPLWIASCVLLASAFLFGDRLHVESIVTVAIGYPLVGMFSALSVAVLDALPSKPRLSGLERALLPVLFCIYLFKLPVVYELAHLLPPSSGVVLDLRLLLVSGLLATLLACALYLFVQRPAQALWLRAFGGR